MARILDLEAQKSSQLVENDIHQRSQHGSNRRIEKETTKMK